MLLRHHGEMRAGLILAMVLWGIASLAALPPLDGPPPGAEALGPLRVAAVVTVAVYAFAAWRYFGLWRRRGGIVP